MIIKNIKKTSRIVMCEVFFMFYIDFLSGEGGFSHRLRKAQTIQDRMRSSVVRVL